MSQLNTQNRFVQFIENVLFEDDPQPICEQVVIEPGISYSVPRYVRRIEIVVGDAWASHLGHDVMLRRGQATLVDPRQDAVLISAVGANPVVMNQSRQ